MSQSDTARMTSYSPSVETVSHDLMNYCSKIANILGIRKTVPMHWLHDDVSILTLLLLTENHRHVTDRHQAIYHGQHSFVW